MNQPQDTGLSQEEFLERLLQGQHQQYQQKVQNHFSGNRNANENTIDSVDANNINNSESLFVGRPSGNASFSSGNNGTNKSPVMALTNSIGIDINHQQQQQQQQLQQQQQQSRMMNYFQERQQQQQQQQLMAGSTIGGSSDLSSTLGIATLSSNVGLDSRLGGNGIGSGISPNSWMDGLNLGGLGSGTISNAGASLYSTEQDLLRSTQRSFVQHPLVGNTIGANRLTINGEGNGSITDNALASLLGGLPQICVPQHNLAHAQESVNTQQKPSAKTFTDLFLAKQAQAALLQAAQARLPRTMRLPCGARGMTADHNSSTAYFDVPENARHGQHLLCSHSVCRAAGVKFRYCFYCKKPVTKQNFRSRHLHANLDPNNKKKDEKEADGKRKKSNGKVEPKKKNDSMKRKPNTNGKTSTNTSGETVKKLVRNDDNKDPIESLAALPVIDVGQGDLRNGIENKLERPSKIRKLSILDGEQVNLRRDKWEALLQERPSDDLQEIHSWTRKVLSVSHPDLDSSVLGSIDVLKLQKQQKEGSPLQGLSPDGLLDHWNSLLDRRPNGESNGTSVTNWLAQALKLINEYKE